MDIIELEQVLDNYSKFSYQTSENPKLNNQHISYNQEFDAAIIAPYYPSVVLFVSNETRSSFALWNVRTAEIKKHEDHDVIVFAMLGVNESPSKTVKAYVNAYHKT